MANIVTSRTRDRRFRAPNRPWRLALNHPFARDIQSAFVAGPSYSVAISAAGQSAESSNSSNVVHAPTVAGWGVRRLNANNVAGELTPSAVAPLGGWSGDATILFVGWRNNTTGSNNRTVFTLRDASGPLFQWKDVNGTISATTYYNTTTGFATTSATDTDTAHKNTFFTIAFRSRYNGSTYDQSVWLNGVQDANVARSQGLRTFSSSVGAVQTWAMPDATGGNVFGGDIYEISGGVFFKGALTDAALRGAHYDPWFWLEDFPRRIFVPAAGGGTIEADLASAGTGTATFVGESTAEGALSSAGTGTASFAGESTADGALSSAGAGTATFTGESTAEGVLASAGSATASWDAEVPGSDLASAGSAVATFTAEWAAAGALAATGTGLASFTGESTAEAVLAVTGTATASWDSTAEAEVVSSPAGAGRGSRRRKYRRRVLIDGRVVVVDHPEELRQLLAEYDAQLKAQLERAVEQEAPTKALKRRIRVVERRLEAVEQEVADGRAERRKRDEEVLVLWSMLQ